MRSYLRNKMVDKISSECYDMVSTKNWKQFLTGQRYDGVLFFIYLAIPCFIAKLLAFLGKQRSIQ